MRSRRSILHPHFSRRVIQPVSFWVPPAFLPWASSCGLSEAGCLVGWMADTHGRRTSMVISVLMMCAGSLLIAVMPTYTTIGAMAPMLLLFARLVQGLSVGGEYGTAATYMSEVASKGNRGFYSSFQYVTLIGGELLALLVLAVLQMLLTTEELKAWGWRIPFVIGAMAAIVA